MKIKINNTYLRNLLLNRLELLEKEYSYDPTNVLIKNILESTRKELEEL